MNLFLIRHGEAEQTATNDDERALTSAGRKAIAKIAHHVTALPEKPTLLFSSPLVRARQTAQEFAKGWQTKMEIVEWLCPEVGPSAVLDHLKQLAESSVALVGHLPNLGYVFGTFLGGLPPHEMVIPRGGVALLDLKSWEPGTGKLKWLLTPEILDK